MAKLNGKKIIFIGNSFTFFGNCVLYAYDRPSQEDGYFAKLVKAMGDSAAVTNFTYGGAGFVDGRDCTERDGLPKEMKEYGVYQLLTTLHPGYVGNPDGLPVEDFYRQDVVVLQQRGADLENTYDDAKKVEALFAGKPQMVFLMVSYAYLQGHRHVMEAAEKLRRDGHIVVEWGKEVYDCIQSGTIGGVMPCNKNTFIVDRSERDGFHPNDLSGYLTAMMLYSRLTGISAVGMPYDFVGRDMTHYGHGGSNFAEVLENADAMRTLQQISDGMGETR